MLGIDPSLVSHSGRLKKKQIAASIEMTAEKWLEAEGEGRARGLGVWACPGGMLVPGHVCPMCPKCVLCVLCVLSVSWRGVLAQACPLSCVSRPPSGLII